MDKCLQGGKKMENKNSSYGKKIFRRKTLWLVLAILILLVLSVYIIGGFNNLNEFLFWIQRKVTYIFNGKYSIFN